MYSFICSHGFGTVKYRYYVGHSLFIANLWRSLATLGCAYLKCYGLKICKLVRSKDAAEFKKLNGQSFFYIISHTGPTNFLESYLVGNFFKILAKHKTAFFLTLREVRFVKATSIIVSATAETKQSGAIVPIVEKARDCAG